MRQIGGLAAAQLQRHRVFFGMEAQVALHIAVDQCARGHHLGVEQGVAAQQPVQVAAMAVGPVHHRGNGHFVHANLLIYNDIFQLQNLIFRACVQKVHTKCATAPQNW